MRVTNHRRMRRRRAACALVAAIAVGACSSSSSTVDSARSVPVDTVDTSLVPAGSEPVDTSTAPASEGALTSLLSAMPAPSEWGVALAEPVTFVLADVDAAETAAGSPRPVVGTATDESVGTWFAGLYGRGLASGETSSVAMPPLPPSLSSITLQAVTAAAVFGWSVLDVHAYIADLFGTLIVLRLPTEPAWPTGPGELSSDGVWSLGDREAAHFDWLPQQPESSAVRLTWRAGLLSCSGSTALARAALATDRPTLADSPAFVEVTRAIDAVGAYGAVVLTPSVYSLSDFKRHNPRASESDVERWAEQLVPLAFDALGIGSSVDDQGERVTTFVYRHSDADAAAANTSVLETLFREGSSIKGHRLFSDMFSVRSVEVTGNLVVVTVVGSINPISLVNDHENITVTR